MMKKSVVGIIVLIFVISGCFFVFWNRGDSDILLGQFDPVVWAENPFNRRDMIDSLEEQYDLMLTLTHKQKEVK